ncbi:STAS domain-containing protein [Streptomyces sp. NPDC093546]|uniref:STAS domain-containing protein n=1 Tax=Streptomyces sp. NPDC093546 TaxID=3366040 RepID=UPI0038102A60
MDTTDPLVFRLAGPLGPDDVPRLCAELAELLDGAAAGTPVDCDVGGVTGPGLVTVEALARLRLTAQRLGHPLAVRGAAPGLRALLRLVGLEGLLGEVTPPGGPEGRTTGTSASRPGTT